MNDDEIKNKDENVEPVDQSTAAEPTDAAEDIELVADEEYGDEVGESAVKKLRAKLKDSQAKCQEYMTGWQRAKADYVNVQRQHGEDRTEFLKFAERKLMNELLVLADSFDLALSSAPPGDDWQTGIRNIRTQLEKLLESHGVKMMEDQVGKKFDPTLHEALMTEPVESEAEDDTVLMELAKGYMIHDQLLRPAKVKVGEFKK